jgi:Ser/Thr protein kinase RdoA (MazF antagonist)
MCFEAPNKHKPHYGRLLKWIPGKVFASIQHHSNSLLRDLGRALAKIDQVQFVGCFSSFTISFIFK